MSTRWGPVTASAAVAAVAATGLAMMTVMTVPVYSHKPITTNILYKNEIAQIFQRKCFQCHSENNLSMSLTTYTDARPWARAIREEVLERKMPPWQAVPGYGHFANDIGLNTREKEIILSWADGGAPSGVLKAEESIPPVYVATEPSWDHGAPDLVLPIGAGHSVPTAAPFELKRIVVDTNLPAAKRIRAFALKQGDRRVVRHAAFYEEGTGRWIGGWTPWQTISQFAEGVAVRLPANARIAVEIGYSGADQDVTDRSEIGLYFAEGDGSVADTLSLAAAETNVAPGTTSQRVRTETKIAAPTRILAFWLTPGAHARSVEIAMVTPDGMSTPLLWVNEYRPEWRSPYVLESPVEVPRGSRLLMTTHFDNAGERDVKVSPQAWVVTAAASRPASAPRK